MQAPQVVEPHDDARCDMFAAGLASLAVGAVAAPLPAVVVEQLAGIPKAKPGQAPELSDSDASGSDASDSSSCAEAVLAGALAEGIVNRPAAPAEPMPAPAAPRQPRGVQWGPAGFSLAPIVSHGQNTGYGATCFLHCNHGDANSRLCKKTLNFGAEGLSPEECIVRLKRWLIAGLQIDPNNHDARDMHRMVDARHECSHGVDPEQLDQHLVTAWAAWRAAHPPAP